MRRAIFLLIASVMAFALIGCDGGCAGQVSIVTSATSQSAQQ